MSEIMKKRNDKLLPSPPDEQISAVRFLPAGDDDERFVVVTAWDGSLRLYDTHKELLVLSEKYCEEEMPILALAASKDAVAFGGLDKNVYVKKFDLQSQSGQKPGDTAFRVGSHEGTVTAVEFCDEHNVIVTGGRDANIRLWSADRDPIASVGNIRTEGQIFRMNVRGNLIAAGLSENIIGIWDIRNFDEPLKSIPVMESYNLSCIAIFPDLKRIVYGTAQGKASIESIEDRNSKNNFVFKPHVDKTKAINHPVNCVRFIEGTSRFLMGGSDGKVRLWDPDTRKLLADFTPYPNEISAIDTSPSGKYAVIACSYLDDRELKAGVEASSPELYLRNISEYIHNQSLKSN